MKVQILGTEYKINFVEDTGQPWNGRCDFTSKKIEIVMETENEQTVDDIEVIRRKILRHEIIHAFLHESGLANSSEWAVSEEAIDWIALQFPKILEAFEKSGALIGE